jgi:hypothetical protein
VCARVTCVCRIRIDSEVKEAQLRADQQHEFLRIESHRKKQLLNIAAQAELTEKTMEADLLAQKAKLLVRLAELEIQREEMRLEHERAINHAKAQNLLLTDNYVAVESSRHLANNLKIYYGDRLPKLTVGVLATQQPQQRSLPSQNESDFPGLLVPS